MKFLDVLYQDFVGGRAGLGLLVLRVVTGAGLMLHGLPKLAHPFSWMGDKLPGLLQGASVFAEFFGGLAILLGLLTPVACVLVIINMAVAIITAHLPNGDPWIGHGRSFEAAASYLVTAVALLLTGPGMYSLDAKVLRRPFSSLKSGGFWARAKAGAWR